MKRTATTFLTLLCALSLTAVAHADIIASPGVTAAVYTLRFLPYILVGAVVGVTAFLLHKFWKKKK